MKGRTTAVEARPARTGATSTELDVALQVLEETHASRARERGVRLKTERPGTRLHVDADPNHLLDLIDGLAGHAIERAPSKSSVRIWSSSTPCYVLLFVQSDGPGLPMHRCRVLAERIGAQVGRQTRMPRGAVTWLLLPRAIAPPTAAAS